MIVSNIKGFFSTYAVQVLGGALAVSLALNIGLGFGLKHYVSKAASVKTAVILADKVATEKKDRVEKRQEKNVVQTQDRTTNRITAVTDSLRRNRPKPDLPQAGAGSGSPQTEGGTTIFLPDGSVVVDGKTFYRDQEICLKNTVLVEEWQTFYDNQLTIQEEENVGTDK